MRVTTLGLFGLLSLAAGITHAGEPAAETLYLAPRHSLPLLIQPRLGTPSARNITTDESLLVVARQGEFVQVRTPDGEMGWVRVSQLTTQAPRSDDAIRAENAELVVQARTLDAQVRAFQEENVSLRARLGQVEAELAVMTRPVPLTLQGISDLALRLLVDLRFWTGLALVVLGLVLAFVAGVRWRNQRIRERLGGLDL
jgi:hypothetical protein